MNTAVALNENGDVGELVDVHSTEPAVQARKC